MSYEIEGPQTDRFIAALRSGDKRVAEEAADILELLVNQMQAHSPNMSGEMSYRLRGSGWPMTHCKGFGQLDALRNVLAEIKREREGGAE
jgi:hypothetical protein